jgi:uncharacterized membrane protein YoaK (UPF0700 family)
MKKRYPKELIWVWLLYLSAGYLNALTLILFSETAVGQTGRTTNMIYYFFQASYSLGLRLLILSLCFLAGSVIYGILFSRIDFNPQSRRIGWFSIFTGAIFVGLDLIPGLSPLVLYYVCIMLGFQNSLNISYRGSTVSSTVITSVISNFGSAMGNYLRGEKEGSLPRVFYFSSNILAHILGSSLCFMVYFTNEFWLLEVAMLIYLIIGIHFLIFRKDFTVEGTSIG